MARPSIFAGRRATTVAAVAASVAAMSPASASAHGLVQRADLPIPEWLFGWAAAIVLVVSFGALAVMWTEPRLDRGTWRPLPGAIGRVLGSKPVELASGVLGAGLLVIVIWAGFAGSDGSQDNLAPTFVLVIAWVGFVFAGVLLGDVFRAVNPWRAIGRATGWSVTRVRRGKPPIQRPYPSWLGHWPAAAGLLGFTWLELASGWADDPQRLVTAAVGYTVVTLTAMAIYGTEPWARNGEAFGVYYNLFSRLSVLEAREGVVGVRPMLSGLPGLQVRPGTVAMLMVMIGTVTFDGLSQGALWRDMSGTINFDLLTRGIPVSQALVLTNTAGLALCVILIAAFYALGIAGARSVGGPYGVRKLRAAFVHSLVPIAMVYVAAHYLTFLLFQGQAMFYLISDPLGEGWNLFGTATAAIDYGVISQNGAWYVQVAFVVCGHVAALVLAHDRALGLYGQARIAVRSQYWMLAIMIGFTTFALWLLAQANA